MGALDDHRCRGCQEQAQHLREEIKELEARYPRFTFEYLYKDSAELRMRSEKNKCIDCGKKLTART